MHKTAMIHSKSEDFILQHLVYYASSNCASSIRMMDEDQATVKNTKHTHAGWFVLYRYRFRVYKKSVQQVRTHTRAHAQHHDTFSPFVLFHPNDTDRNIMNNIKPSPKMTHRMVCFFFASIAARSACWTALLARRMSPILVVTEKSLSPF